MNLKRKYSIACVTLAQQIIDSERGLQPGIALKIYRVLCCAVYGAAIDVKAEDLVHCLAEMMNMEDPSEPSS
jgi:hypothetical protein